MAALHQDHDLALGAASCHLRGQLVQRAAAHLLEFLGQLAAHRRRGRAAQHLGGVAQHRRHALGRFVEDQRRRHPASSASAVFRAPGRIRQEPREEEPVRRQPPSVSAASAAEGPGASVTVSRRLRLAHQVIARDRRSSACRPPRRRPPIAHRQRRQQARPAPRRCDRDRPQRPPPSGDAVDLHQPAQAARVLGREHIGRGEHVERAQRDVARRPDGRRHEVQPRVPASTSARIHHWTRPA